MECVGKDCYWFGNDYLNSCPKLNPQRYTHYKEIDWSNWERFHHCNQKIAQEDIIVIPADVSTEPIYITTIIIKNEVKL